MTLLTVTELAERIVTTVHPSLLEPGPIAGGLQIDKFGRRLWHPEKLTRLAMPASPSGFGERWIDYPTATEAAEACDRARETVQHTDSPEAAWAALDRFYAGE